MDIEDFIEQLTAWHNRQVEQLHLILDHSEAPIRVEGVGGEPIELTVEQARGFRAGVRQSLNLLGKLPFTVSRDEEE